VNWTIDRLKSMQVAGENHLLELGLLSGGPGGCLEWPVLAQQWTFKQDS
jgi:hypothetical protein